MLTRPSLGLSGGLLEITEIESYSGFISPVVTVTGGNLSIRNPAENLLGIALGNTLSGVLDGGGVDAWQIQVFLQDTNFTFLPHMRVNYNIGNMTINAITDSQGRLFMYLPVGMESSLGRMVYGGNVYTEFLSMSPDHDNILILTLGDTVLPPVTPPTQPPTERRGPLWFQIGANAGQGVRMYIEAMDAYTLGLRNLQGNIINVLHETGYDISPLLNILDAALAHANVERSKLGAMQNRLEHTMSSLAISSENLQAAESRIRNADMAREMLELTQANILQQAAIMILAQANQAPQAVLQILGQ